MRAIILAAGMGTRLGDLTTETPKALMPLRGRTLLERQIANYRDAGVDDICIVRGYLADQIDYEGVTYFENPDYAVTGLLPSLFAARDAMAGGFVFSYADTTWRTDNARKLVTGLAGTEAMGCVVDVDWRDVYVGRDQHPLEEAECVAVEAGRIVRMGKSVTPDQAHGEVAGMGGFSAAAAAKAVAAWDTLTRDGLDVPFGQKKVLRHAYVADLMQHLADTQGVPWLPIEVNGGWREIDTPQDLERAERDVDW